MSKLETSVFHCNLYEESRKVIRRMNLPRGESKSLTNYSLLLKKKNDFKKQHFRLVTMNITERQ